LPFGIEGQNLLDRTINTSLVLNKDALTVPRSLFKREVAKWRSRYVQTSMR
jgi:hypothetical protein